MTNYPAVIDLVEYYPPGMVGGALGCKERQVYEGVGPRESDGISCLSIRAPGASRRHNIDVQSVHAITMDGVRHVLDVPWQRWRLREQEIVKIVEGDFSEEWAREYFDPNSPKYYRNPEPAHHPEAAAEPPTHVVYVPLKRPFWRWLVFVLLIGYMIGRFRWIRWGLHAAGKHWGLWL